MLKKSLSILLVIIMVLSFIAISLISAVAYEGKSLDRVTIGENIEGEFVYAIFDPGISWIQDGNSMDHFCYPCMTQDEYSPSLSAKTWIKMEYTGIKYKVSTYESWDVYKAYISRKYNYICFGTASKLKGEDTYSQSSWMSKPIYWEKGKAFLDNYSRKWVDLYKNESFEVLEETFNHNLSYFAKFWNSTEYNPELAHLMMTFANAAYDPSKAEQGYSELGMTSWIPVNYEKTGSVYGTENVCYNIGSVVDDTGTICVLLALRGSGDIADISQGTLDWLGNLDVDSAFQIGYQPHKNFQSTAAHVYDGINTYLSAKYNTSISEGSNIKYFVTGHSRGAAVANLVEYMLEPKVGKQNLYGYNFAVPDTAKISDQTNVKGFDNIFNISNLQDPVSYVPGHIVDVLTSVKQWLASGRVENKWRKWGESIWFSDESGAIDAAAHSPTRYLDYMRSRKSLSTYTETPKFYDEWKKSGWGPFMKVEYKLYATYCPVNVELVDENGKVVASIIDGVVDYHDSHFGEVIATTVDDHKMFAVPSDKNYTLKMVGKDTGTLDYYVAKTDVFGNDTSIVKAFENVALDKDKEMVGALVNVRNEDDKTIKQEEKLLLSNNDSEAGIEILPNGEEKECVSRFVLGDVNNNGGIDITDATFVQRKLTKIDTPYTDEILQQGDVDGNGTLELMDVTAIQYYLNQMNIPYLIGVNVYTQ